ncbi:DinB family protein [Nocardia sp. NBC_01730]|uniref:mycothiol transferase n=1 Tax=Nocardia sp. NBC_01730 TaxID=2975998 RepID=UPI002E1603D4|nr:DinB family protein [Nocardia sp. NBC_01730]
MSTEQEREDLVAMLADQRELFRITLRGIDDELASRRTTTSELTLGGLLHHLISCERHWTAVIVERDEHAELDLAEFEGEYVMAADETVAGLLATWDEVAAATAELIRSVKSLDTSIPTPTTPWTPDRIWQSVRYTVLHILREIAHHSGHADFIREALDGASTTHQRAS